MTEFKGRCINEKSLSEWKPYLKPNVDVLGFALPEVRGWDEGTVTLLGCSGVV